MKSKLQRINKISSLSTTMASCQSQWVHPPGYTLTTTPSLPNSVLSCTISLLVQNSNVFFFSSHSLYQSPSMDSLLSGFPHILPYIPFKQAYHYLFSQYYQITGEHLVNPHSSFINAFGIHSILLIPNRFPMRKGTSNVSCNTLVH